MICTKKIWNVVLAVALSSICSGYDYDDNYKSDSSINADYDPLINSGSMIPDLLTSSEDSFNRDLSGIMKEEDLSFGKDTISLKAPEYGVQADDSRTGTSDQ